MNKKFSINGGFTIALEISDDEKSMNIVFKDNELTFGNLEAWLSSDSLARESILESINDELQAAMYRGYTIQSLGLKPGINPLIEIGIENVHSLETSIVSSPILSGETIKTAEYILSEILDIS